MATLLLAAAGSALGGMFGATAAVLGQAAGAVVGGLLDGRIFGSSSSTSSGRLTSLDVQSSDEGAVIPRVFGRMRLSGQVIWATPFEEESSTESVGGKSSRSKVTSYSYYGNFAVGLCEGPIARVGRVWANGSLLDLTKVTMRVYRGDEEQEPDSLILANEETAPAYRGLAYVVFEHLPLDDFGDALPQLSFEVIRPIGRLETAIKAVTLIPAATEFGYATTEVVRKPSRGVTEPENRHAATATTDLVASLDELQAVCPNLEAVALVVTWFGDDLRAGICTLRPQVESATKKTGGLQWSVSGVDRADARTVSQIAGSPAYGGTPSDATVVEAIVELKRRGLAVTFYPFVMMDVPAGNGLADPYGGDEQAVYPWRGRITCQPARGLDGSPWGTAAIDGVVADFLGDASSSDFVTTADTVTFSGGDDWGYRRMILHYAHLCALAGGVDAFLVGSELPGLTKLADDAGDHPFVAALVTLAGEVKTILGAATAVSYAADWSEWTGDNSGGGDFTFHLDPLWTSDDIDFVGIDAYFPLSDWRDGDPADAASWNGPLDADYLAGNVAGGEGFDWYYASTADRAAGSRTPITDGLGKPWIWRYKDLVSWWSNLHYDRSGGAEAATPSAWRPGLKPIRLTEIGCPAVDLGTNQPNVFPDTNSSEGRSPYFSHCRRDDAAQRRYLEALLGHFDPEADAFNEAGNPLSPLDGRRMVEAARSHVWTWDARPYPWFPLATDVWSDGDNWQTGHWLNGRLGAAPLRELVETLADGLDCGTLDAEGLTAVVDGLAVTGRSSLRDIVEPLAAPFLFDLVETADGLRIRDRLCRVRATLVLDDLVSVDEEADVSSTRAEDADIPGEVAVSFLDGEADGRSTSVSSRRSGPPRVEDASLPVMASASVMQGAADAWLRDLEAGRETIALRLPSTCRWPEPGDVFRLDLSARVLTLMITSIEDGDSRAIEARTIDAALVRRSAVPGEGKSPTSATATPSPVVIALDLPARDDDDTPYRPWLAAAASPWTGGVTVARTIFDLIGERTTLSQCATIGTLEGPLAAGPVWRFDRKNAVEVTLVRGTLSSVSDEVLLEGGNLAAIGSMETGWEIVQFAKAELVGSRRYRLSRLVRGGAGSERLAASGHAAGVDFVLLDRKLARLPMTRGQVGRPMSLRYGVSDLSTGSSDGGSLSLTPAGIGLVPLSPVHLDARRSSATGDIAFAWIRRTRQGGDDFDGVEVALGEESERYRLDVVKDGSTVRSLVSDTPATVYTAAEQVADFGGLPSKLDVSLVQLSSTVGDGWPLAVTVEI